MKFHRLPTDCLLHLFNSYFTLQELFALRTICSTFSSVIESRHCIGRRKSLKLFWSFEDIQLYTCRLYHATLEHVKVLKLGECGHLDNDDLIMNVTKCANSTEMGDWLARLLPNVRHLVIFFGLKTGPVYSIIPYLLTRWSNLRGVSLFGQFYPGDFDPEHRLASQLCESLNKLSQNLIHLDYCVDNLFDNGPLLESGETSVRVNLPVTLNPMLLNRLERFFFTHASEDFSERVIKHLGPNCATIGFDLVRLDPGELVQSLTTCLNLVPSNITRLRLSQDMDNISTVCHHFTNIRSLDLHNTTGEMQLERLLPRLRPLVQLTELKLAQFEFYAFEQKGFKPRRRLPVLDRITCLTIEPGLRSMDLRDRLQNPQPMFRAMAHTFPSLSQFTLRLSHPYFHTFSHLMYEDRKLLALFPLLSRFVLYYGQWLHSEIFFNLMARHHVARYAREWKRVWVTTHPRIFIGCTGVQIWTRTLHANQSLRKMKFNTDWKTSDAQMRFYRERILSNR